jgi:hypothetical protein
MELLAAEMRTVKDDLSRIMEHLGIPRASSVPNLPHNTQVTRKVNAHFTTGTAQQQLRDAHVCIEPQTPPPTPLHSAHTPDPLLPAASIAQNGFFLECEEGKNTADLDLWRESQKSSP